MCMPNCPHCVKMQQHTLELPHVEKLVTSSFETLNVNRTTHAKLVQKLKIKCYPTTLLVDPNNKVLDMIEGYVDAKKFQVHLQTGLASMISETQTR
ncbi:MAG: thioredoxin family protein [Pirellulales bacterium]|nr:thioredoxin family protein [Pirellulales bacterium]